MPTPEQAAWLAVSIPLAYARQGRNLAWAAMAGREVFEPLVHHPRRDVVDAQAGTRFYYHAHPVAGQTLQEHGHFHLFHEDGRGFSHLAGLSLDAQGRPLRWFCTNRWVTGEHWRSAPQWRAPLRAYRIRTSGRLAPVAQWLDAMVHLYRHELQVLLQERDARVQRGASTVGRQAWLDDRQQHILCSCPISLQDKVQALL